MKIAALSVPYSALSLRETLKIYKKLGLEAIELGCGGFPGKAHCDPRVLLSDRKELQEFRRMIADSGIQICALSCHGNSVHPNAEIAARDEEDFRFALRLAGELSVDTVVTFSGCPGDGAGAIRPNWVTCAWPDDFARTLDYQWNDVLIPYWQSAVCLAAESGVNKIALEMHPGFCVYNPETLLRLRGAVGDLIGANFDPSHLFWQGIDPVCAIEKLGKAIYFVHAKDCAINIANAKTNGVLDTKHYGNLAERAWSFRTVGYGHGESVWRNIVSTLQLVGYDGAVSLEHEDALMSIDEGFEKAIELLKRIVIRDAPAEMWWA